MISWLQFWYSRTCKREYEWESWDHI